LKKEKKGRFIIRRTQRPAANAKVAAVLGSIPASYAPTQWQQMKIAIKRYSSCISVVSMLYVSAAA
jgi:hypothetical protein